MGNAILKFKKETKYNKVIIVLSIVALVLSCLDFYNSQQSFLDYGFDDIITTPATVLQAFLIFPVPCAILVYYIFNKEKHKNPNIILCLIFAIMLFGNLYYMVGYELFSSMLFKAKLNIIIPTILMGYTAYAIYKGKSKKTIVTLIAIVGAIFIFQELKDDISFIKSRVDGSYNSLLKKYGMDKSYDIGDIIIKNLDGWLVFYAGSLSFYISTIMVFVKNKVCVTTPKEEEVIQNTQSVEEVLKVLKQKLELNEITQEEYETKKAEIINRL